MSIIFVVNIIDTDVTGPRLNRLGDLKFLGKIAMFTHCVRPTGRC